MVQLSNREKNIFIVCALLIATYSGYIFVYQPLKEAGVTFEDQLEAAQRQLEKSSRIVNKGKMYQSRYNSYMAKFKQTASNDEVMSATLSKIEQEAGKFDIRISELKPQKVKKESFYNNFSVSVTLEGTMTEIVKLLYALQNEPYSFKVDEARFDQHYQKVDSVQCQFILSKIYFP